MSHLKLTEAEYQALKNKTKGVEIYAVKKRNAQPEEAMKKEFYKLVCLQLPKEVEYLYRIEPFAFRKLINKENSGIAMGITKQLQNSGYQKGEFDYEFRKRERTKTYCGDHNIDARDFYCSLHIEFKHGKNKLTPEQEVFKIQQESQDRKCIVCYSADEGVEAINKYLRGEL